jgi:hypothetical protein
MSFLGLLSGEMSEQSAKNAVEVARQKLVAAREQLCG